MTDLKTQGSCNLFSPIEYRHRLVAEQISGEHPTILDVGGYVDRGQYFLRAAPAAQYTSINVGAAWYSGAISDLTMHEPAVLPIKNAAYDYCVSVDALEHVEKKHRLPLLREMKRVARKGALVLFPFRQGTQTHEALILTLCKLHGLAPPPSLVEHELYGLPTIQDIREWKNELGGSVSYRTNRHIYWAYQTAMIINSVAGPENAEHTNVGIRAVMEANSLTLDPVTRPTAYRVLLRLPPTE